MPKGERKRRRRDEQENAATSPEAEQFTGEQTGEEKDSAASAFAQPADEEGGERETESGTEQSAAPRRVALAEVLSKPVFPNVPPERVIPPRTAADVFAEPPPASQDFTAKEEPQQTAQGREPDPYAAEPESSFESVPPPSEMETPRERRSGEPVLLALLLAVLVVLLVNTYFTMRLNGVSDRLNAAVANSATATAERPWVGVDKITTVAFANGGQPVTTVHIVNSGHEPASDLRSNTAGSLRSASTPAPEIPKQKGQLAVTALLMPNVGGNLTFFANTRALTSEEAANVRAGKYVLWLAGRLDYKDSHGHPHLTTFRYRYNPALNSFVATPQDNNAN